jgi:NNP family nitrate/nitrite transporter-like MFS transporter
MTGAYGNVGAVCYLTVLSFVSYSAFFWVIAASAFLGLLMLFLMQEPEGSMAEILPDGSVELIKVN